VACYSPISAFRGRVNPESGKSDVVFCVRDSRRGESLTLPCGNCIGCRLDRSRSWAIRCWHEASLYDSNCFCTLTYSPENLPSDGGLVLKHFQDFMKRLRKRFGEGIRFFHCGEYGERLERPHYHVLIFNFDFSDKELISDSRGVRLYHSQDLEDLWGKGFCSVGDLTFDSAAYVARYVMKKVNGELAADHYDGKAAEYVTMSRRPGIGRLWYDKFSSDVFPGDFVVHDGSRYRPPKFYDKLLEKSDPVSFEKIKAQRVKLGRVLSADNDLFRLRDKEAVKRSRLVNLTRKMEVS